MKTRNILIALGVVALAATTHCSSRYSTYCDNQRNCSGGNDKDVDACIEQQRTYENVSSAYDCDDQWDSLADCLEKATCKDKRLDSSGCSAQASAWAKCTNAASGHKNQVEATSSSSSSPGSTRSSSGGGGTDAGQ